MGQIGTFDISNSTLKKKVNERLDPKCLALLELTLRHYFGSDEQIFGGFYSKKNEGSSGGLFHAHTRMEATTLLLNLLKAVGMTQQCTTEKTRKKSFYSLL